LLYSKVYRKRKRHLTSVRLLDMISDQSGLNVPNLTMSKKLTVRAGRNLDSRIVSEMSKNDIVNVNKITGRQARLVNKADGQELGWTSLFTAEGNSLLEQLEDD